MAKPLEPIQLVPCLECGQKELVVFKAGLLGDMYCVKCVDCNPHEIGILRDTWGPVKGEERGAKRAWNIVNIPYKQKEIKEALKNRSEKIGMYTYVYITYQRFYTSELVKDSTWGYFKHIINGKKYSLGSTNIFKPRVLGIYCLILKDSQNTTIR